MTELESAFKKKKGAGGTNRYKTKWPCGNPKGCNGFTREGATKERASEKYRICLSCGWRSDDK